MAEPALIAESRVGELALARQWQNGEDIRKVWFHFERLMLAYKDLKCA